MENLLIALSFDKERVNARKRKLMRQISKRNGPATRPTKAWF